MTKHAKPPAIHLSARQGEGFSIETERQQVVGVDGTTNITLGINIAQAPVPDRRYVADVVSVQSSKGGYLLLFGQQRLGRPDLRSLLVIHMTSTAAMSFLRSCLEISDPTLEQLAKSLGIVPVAPADIDDEPEQTVAMSANLVGVAVANDECCLDLYHMSAATVHAANKGGKVQVIPVVRVEMSTGQLIGLLEELKKLPSTLTEPGDTHGRLRSI